MKKILITGGAGTIGKAFIRRYQDKFKFYRENYNFDNVIKMVEHYEPENKYLSKVLQRTKK